MKKTFLILTCAALALLSAGVSAESQKHSIVLPEGFVPDEKTAIRIAEAVGIPIYGEKTIAGQRPLKASLQGDVWTVVGSLPEVVLGGVLLVEISKKDARILRMSHGQ